MKLSKYKVEQKVKNIIERSGGTYLSINWNKRIAHFLTPKGVKKSEPIMFNLR
jgi:hypothetical protein